MEPLATVEQLENHLGRSVKDGAELTRAEMLLGQASRRARRAAGQQFTAGESHAHLRVAPNCTVTLPQRPVTAVLDVADVDGQPVQWTWPGGDVVRLSSSRETVVVHYQHGYPAGELPEDVVGIVCQMVARAIGRKADESGITQESIAGYSVSVGAAGAAGAVGLLPDEKAALTSYRRRARTIWIGQ